MLFLSSHVWICSYKVSIRNKINGYKSNGAFFYPNHMKNDKIVRISTTLPYDIDEKVLRQKTKNSVKNMPGL